MVWLLRHGHQELRSCCSHQDATKAKQHEVAIATVALPVDSLFFEVKSQKLKFLKSNAQQHPVRKLNLSQKLYHTAIWIKCMNFIT